MALLTKTQATKPIPCGSCRALARLRKRWVRHLICRLCRRLRSLAGARQLPQLSFVAGRICVRRGGPADQDPSNKADPLWELSSFSEAAKAVAQATYMSPMPQPSQPRWGSTAPTVELCCWWNLRSTRWPCKPKPQQQSRSPVGALVISLPSPLSSYTSFLLAVRPLVQRRQHQQGQQRSEEHTSELQSQR